GDQVPVSVNRVAATATTPGQTNPNFQDATIKLKIKPFISPATHSIRMEIDQKIKQPTTVEGLPKELSDNAKPLATRSVKTQIIVNDGDTAIIGGLMRDQDEENVSKVPLLGDLPIIGW